MHFNSRWRRGGCFTARSVSMLNSLRLSITNRRSTNLANCAPSLSARRLLTASLWRARTITCSCRYYLSPLNRSSACACTIFLLRSSYAVAYGYCQNLQWRAACFLYPAPMRYAWLDLNINGTHRTQNPILDQFMQTFQAVWDQRPWHRPSV